MVVGATFFAFNVDVSVFVVLFAFAPDELVVMSTNRTRGLEPFVVTVGTAKSSSGLSNKCLSSDDELEMACTSAGDNGPVDVVVPVSACLRCVVGCVAFCSKSVVCEVVGDLLIVGVEV